MKIGITIESKRYSCDMGYYGFNRFRTKVAELVNKEFYNHYIKLDSKEVPQANREKRKKYFEKYDKKTKELIKNGKVSIEIANFCYQSDCSGKINKKQANMIYNLIKECDNDIIYGYQGRNDCAKMKDMKEIFGDKTSVKWW